MAIFIYDIKILKDLYWKSNDLKTVLKIWGIKKIYYLKI